MQLDSASNTSFYNIYEMFQNLKKKTAKLWRFKEQ